MSADVESIRSGQCKLCRFARMTPVAGQGMQLQCRYDPPRVVPAMTAQGMGLIAIWPGVEPDGWCGKFSADPMARREAM